MNALHQARVGSCRCDAETPVGTLFNTLNIQLFYPLDKHLKDLLSKLLESGYFENIPTPCNIPEKEELKEEMPGRLEKARQPLQPESVKESGDVCYHLTRCTCLC